MATNIANIPTNAVEILFVEDLTKWLLHRQAGIRYETAIAGPYRDSIFNVFNDDVRKAVNFIDLSLEDEIQEHFSEFVQINEKSFTDYALHYEEIYFEKDFLADYFLEYCVRLVAMAVNFLLFDVTEALNIARHIILKLFEDRGMFAGGWDTLIGVAKQYAKVYQDLQNVITPEISDDESSTDSSGNELPANSSADSLDINEGNQACDYVSNRDQLQKPEREFVIRYVSSEGRVTATTIIKSN